MKQEKNAPKEAVGGKHLKESVIINRPATELYNIWHQFDKLPQFMVHLESVTMTGNGHSHWVAKAPAGTHVEWDAEIVRDIPNELIAWRSVEGSTVATSGEVTFKPATGGRGTVVKVDMHYDPPGGGVGATIASFFGKSPEKQMPMDLRHFKQFVEVGEIITTKGQSAGREASTSKKYDDPFQG